MGNNLDMDMIVDESGNPIYAYQRANGFPIMPVENLVDRQSFVETIERMFLEAQIVFLEGDEGFGATTTAAQFCNAYPDRSICLFIKPSSRSSYSSDYVRLSLAEQLTWFSERSQFTEDSISPIDFRKLIIKVGRKLTKKHPIYFVIDGLQKINNGEQAIDEIFRDILPLWQDNMKFLICGKQSSFEQYVPDIACKYIHQLTLSSQEVQRFMLPLSIDLSDIRTVHTLCQGIPGRLASVRRLLLTGMSLQEVLDSTPEKFPSFLKLEFSRIDSLSEQARQVLAMITFSGRQFNRQDLIKIIHTEDTHILEVLRACPFITEIDADRKIDFVSEAHRRLASSLLASEKTDVINDNVNFLLADPNSKDAINYLPVYFQQLNKASDLVRFLTPEHFTHLLTNTSSLGAVRARSRIGMTAAVALEQSNKVLTFSLMQSVFLSIAKSEGSNAQIRALVALGEHQTALGIAFNCVTNEERIKFLATYAKKCKEVTKTVNSEIINAIRSAAKSIDLSQLGDTAIDIATDIVHVDQDIALSIVDEVLKGASTSDRDAAFVKISLETPHGENKWNSNTTHTRIADTKLQEFVSSVLALVSDYSYADIISTCEKLDPSRQLSFLAYWISEHKDSESAIGVAEHGLKLMITNSSYSPRMREFRDLAIALPYASDIRKVEALVKRFDSQRGLIQDVAMSIDTVGLQMALAHAETLYDIDAASSRIIDCYIELTDTDDVDTRLQGLALMLRFLREMDRTSELEEKNTFKASIAADLGQLLRKVLENSADHFLIAKYVIAQFARFDLEKAIRISQSLNTEDRRDKAFNEICTSLQEGEISNQTIVDIKKVLPHIKDRDIRWNVFSDFAFNLALRKIKLNDVSIKIMEDHLVEISDNYLCARTTISIVKLRTLSGLPNTSKLPWLFTKAIGNITTTFHQSTFYFDMADALADTDRDAAKECYRLGSETLASSSLPTRAHTQIFTWCLMLCARGIGGAAASGTFKEEMLSRFMQLVDLLPTVATKVEAISELSSRFWIAGRSDLARSLMGGQILPLIDSTQVSNPFNGRILLNIAVPVLYCTHQQIAIARLKQMPRHDREPALALAFDLILTKSPRSDPSIIEAKEDFDLSYTDVLDALALIEIMEEDWNIYGSIHQLSTSITHKRNNSTLTTQQRSDIAAKLKEIYSKSLPDGLNISHDGYLIICEAHDLRIRSVQLVASWDAIIAKAHAIRNIADQGYVLCEISTILPPKMWEKKQAVRNEALSLFTQIPSAIDKINRLIGLSDGTSKDAISIAKQSLKSAMTMTLYMLDERAARDSRRRIIDIADKIKPEFADELADLIDTDRARKAARSEVKDRINMLAVKKKISDVKGNAAITRSEAQHLPEASWKNLLGLIGDRLEIKSPTMMIDYLEQASNFTLKDAFPVFSWFMENTARKYAPSKDASGHIRSMADNVLMTTEFLANAIMAMAAKNTHVSKTPVGEFSGGSLLGLNNRDEAITFIERWLSECEEEIILCDPYFGVKENDLEFFRLVLRASPQSEVIVLTSKSTLAEQGVLSEEQFLEKWRQLCDLDPPVGRILSIGTMKNSKCVIHDRWLISGSRGLKLGTSFNGIGTGKLSGISTLSDGELLSTQNELSKFIKGERYIDGERISYSSFTF
jgi:hypothetical protein